MSQRDRASAIMDLLTDYVKSPSIRHIRDSGALYRLARGIVDRLERNDSLWRKWNSPREDLARLAQPCWIPVSDLRDALNDFPGPTLTNTDVAQRLESFWLDEHESLPNEDLKEGSLAIYHEEKAAGTELRAIIGRLRMHLEAEEQRLFTERQQYWEKKREEQKQAAQDRLMSGADCPWTQQPKSNHFYCRRNGRTYRLSPTKDDMLRLFRVQKVDDDERGDVLGNYQSRGDATKAVKEIAYRPERR